MIDEDLMVFEHEIVWRCDVCKQVRPDKQISVFKAYLQVNGKTINPDVVCRNIKYCNDKPDCCEGVRKMGKSIDE